jgi:RimJ/RimL family protein N-acetyltransferase
MTREHTGTIRLVELDEAPFREYRSYASRILHLVENKARELGAGKVELHVFGHNREARTLYEKLGYTATSIVMAKPVGTEHSGGAV